MARGGVRTGVIERNHIAAWLSKTYTIGGMR